MRSPKSSPFQLGVSLKHLRPNGRKQVLWTLSVFEMATLSLVAGNLNFSTTASSGHSKATSAQHSIAFDEISSSTKQQKIENYLQRPLAFEANQGQTDAQVKFMSRGSGYNLYLTPTE